MKRPTIITVFAVLNLIWAGLGLLCIPIGAVGMIKGSDPTYQIIGQSPFYYYWSWCYLVIGLIGSGILLATGVGFLRLSPWSRPLALYYSILSVVLGIAGGILDASFLYRPMLEQSGNLQGPAAMGMLIGVGIGVIMNLVALVYFVILIVVLRRPSIVAAFEEPQPPAV